MAYDGTDFAGWARQPGLRTVQSELERALTTALRSVETLRTTCAGRTDAGVHARGQVAHVDVSTRALDRLAQPGVPAGSSTRRLLQRLNGLLPSDVAMAGVRAAPPGFDARFAAISRRYRYFVTDTLTRRDPTWRNYTWQRQERLDPARMNEAALPLLGLHDFAAYCRSREGATTIRTLQRLECGRNSRGAVVIDVAADAFCHSMVRSLVGALVMVGSGRRPTSWLRDLQRADVRSPAVQVAPARGLFLEGVDYPDAAGYEARVARTRARRSGESGLL